MTSNLWDQLKAYFPPNLDAGLSLAGVIFVPIIATSMPQPQPAANLYVTFQENFYHGLLPYRWSTTYGSGGNGEMQYYAPEAVTVRDGILRLTATVQEQKGKPYTSGIVHTQERFAQLYGRWEVRARVPAGQGFWSAFWLLTADPKYRPQEIDIFEILGHNTTTAVQVYHDTGIKERGEAYADFTAWHTFALDWTPSALVWYVDGKETHRTRPGVKLPSTPCFLLINLAVGGNWPGSPDSSTPFPSSLEVDFVRVWQWHTLPE